MFAGVPDDAVEVNVPYGDVGLRYLLLLRKRWPLLSSLTILLITWQCFCCDACSVSHPSYLILQLHRIDRGD